MDEKRQNAKDRLLYALSVYEIEVTADAGERVQTTGGYDIEVEQNGVFKLKHEGLVVAPFSDLDELCHFIKIA